MSKPTVLVQGTGLIGTSLGLALKAQGWTVHLHDVNKQALQQAVALGAGIADQPNPSDVDLVVVCVPPAVTVDVVRASLDEFRAAVVTDVASLKEHIILQISDHPSAQRFVGGHPMAGRELSGPTGARSDLFEARPWVLTPSEGQDQQRRTVEDLVSSVGANLVVMDARDHDTSVALTSHLPQILASAMAARLTDADPASLVLTGQGLRDVTRIAASDPLLWGQIVQGNAQAIAQVLGQVIADLTSLQESLSDGGADAFDVAQALIAAGQVGHSKIPGKHGSSAQRYANVSVVIPDEPGALAQLFQAVGELGVNIEDLLLEHSPGQPVGLATLYVAPASAQTLFSGLQASGWVVYR